MFFPTGQHQFNMAVERPVLVSGKKNNKKTQTTTPSNKTHFQKKNQMQYKIINTQVPIFIFTRAFYAASLYTYLNSQCAQVLREVHTLHQE